MHKTDPNAPVVQCQHFRHVVHRLGRVAEDERHGIARQRTQNSEQGVVSVVWGASHSTQHTSPIQAYIVTTSVLQ